MTTLEHRPHLKGVSQDVIFINHDELEDSEATDSRTKTHSHEAEMCAYLVKYFAQQGYSPDQMVVLTPYVGQLLKIQQFLSRSHFQAEFSEKDEDELDGLTSDSEDDTNDNDNDSGGECNSCSQLRLK